MLRRGIISSLSSDNSWNEYGELCAGEGGVEWVMLSLLSSLERTGRRVTSFIARVSRCLHRPQTITRGKKRKRIGGGVKVRAPTVVFVASLGQASGVCGEQ